MVVLASRAPPPPPPSSFIELSDDRMPPSNGEIMREREGLPHGGLQAVPLFPPPPGQTASTMIPTNDHERALLALYDAVQELSEQLEKNRTVATELGLQASRLKMQAGHAQAGFPLRRFNLNLSRDIYFAELRQLTSDLHAQNAELAQDNRQLSSLIREHEATLETVMAKFRVSAQQTQQKELNMARKYEEAIAVRDAELQDAALRSEAQSRVALGRISQSLREAFRAANGEPLAPPADWEPPEVAPLPASAAGENEEAREAALLGSAWALERDCELARLERENAELRRMLGAPQPGYPYLLDEPRLSYTNGSFDLPRLERPDKNGLLFSSGRSAADAFSSSSNISVGSPEITARRTALPPLRTGGLRLSVQSPFPGTGGAMGIGLKLTGPEPPSGQWSSDSLWKEKNASREMREALLG